MQDDQGPNMEVRAFVAVVLSLAVMFGYQYFFASPPAETPVGRVEAPRQVSPPTPEATIPEELSPAGTDAPSAEAGDERAVVTAAARSQVTLETARYRMVLDNRGAVIRSVRLIGFRADFGGELELVVDEGGTEAGFLSLVSPERPEVAAAANQALYRMTVDGVEARSSYRVEAPVEVRWQWVDAAGWSVDKRLTVSPDGYVSDLVVRVESPQRTPIFMTVGPGLEMGADTGRAGIYLMAGAVYFDGSTVNHIAQGDLQGGEVLPADVIWGGIESAYFTALLIPQSRVNTYMAVPAPPESDVAADPGAAADIDAAAGSPGTLASFGIELPDGTPLALPLYIGPKDYNVLAAGGYGLERAVDYGMFRILARPVAVALDTLYDFTGNYGMAIILATFGVRLIFFPLSQSSMKSMRKMQQLQPQMNAIRNNYKGVKDVQKRQEMNAEVMQLYKDNGVSPLGGCLPMLLQMPVLFGFYAAISVSIGIRHAPFGLWLQDLSKMDPYYVLPLLMGASMYGQQRMSPGTGDPMQQRIFRLMPIMFTFFFLTFPSGLVVYWLVNTVLGIGQQAYVNHQLNAADAIATPGPKRKPGNQKGGAAKRKKRGKR